MPAQQKTQQVLDLGREKHFQKGKRYVSPSFQWEGPNQRKVTSQSTQNTEANQTMEDDEDLPWQRKN